VRKLTIAIDGPAGSGKSSVARRVAERLRYRYLDSGAMYRAVALKALENGVPLEDEPGLARLTQGARIELRPARGRAAARAHNRVFLDGKDVTERIRAPEVARAASSLAKIAAVRAELVAQQRRAGASGGVVMEGRDIGTVVFPRAELKIFLDASPEVRAERRWKEHREKGDALSLQQVMQEVRDRDRQDRERKVSPLVRAADAILVDNTAMDVEDTLRVIAMLAKERRQDLAAAARRNRDSHAGRKRTRAR